MNQEHEFALCIRMSSIGDVLMTGRAMQRLYKNNISPILVTGFGLLAVAESFPFLNHVITLQDNGKVNYFKRIDGQKFESQPQLPSEIAERIVAVFDLQSTRRSARAMQFLAVQSTPLKATLQQHIYRVQKRSLFRLKLIFKARFRNQDRAQDFGNSKFKESNESVVNRQLEAVDRFLKLASKGHSNEVKELPIFRPRQTQSVSIPQTQYCVLFAGASLPLKGWPFENCDTFIKKLAQVDLPVVVLGGNDEVALAEKLAERNSNVISMAGKLRLEESFEVISKAAFVVTTDSFPAHVCDLLNIPSIVLFGATSPEFGFAPLSERSETAYLHLNCSPCTRHGKGKCRFGNHKCMKDLSGEGIAQKVIQFLYKKQPNSHDQ
jgi:heptosyltransferase-2